MMTAGLLARSGLVVALLAGCGGDGGGDAGKEHRLLELRPVLDTVATPCRAKEEKDGVIVLPETKDGKTVDCLRLGPAVVDDSDVRSAGVGQTPGGAAVSIVLGRTGATNLDNFAARNLGKRLAIVVRGEILRAPVINSPSFVGRLELVGLDQEEAASLARGLG